VSQRTRLQRALRLSTASLGNKVARGAGFQFVGIALRTVITVGSTAVLARLLTPQDFGLVAMATVITEFAALFGAFGFTNVLIQKSRITRLQLDTVFWATLGLGSLLAVLVLLLSFMAGWLFADPMVASLLQILCVTFVINSLTSVPWVVLSRSMLFQLEFLINITTVIVRTAAAVAAAWLGMGVWSLVVGALVGALTSVVLNFAAVPYRPRLRFDAQLITGTWRTSGSYFGNTALHYASTNLDLILIGRGLGAASLGLYQNARSLTDEIRARIAMPIQHVLFPAFSALQSEIGRFRDLVQRAGRMLAAVVIPIGFGVSANATELVLVLYGQKWVAMTPVMAMFGLSAALRASTAIASPLFSASDRVGQAFRLNLIGAALLITGVLVSMPWGIEGVAVAVALASVFSLYILRSALNTIGLGWGAVGRMLGPPAVAALLMWVVTAGLRALEWSDSPGVALMGHVVAGALIYLGCLLLLSRHFAGDAKAIYATLRSRGR
jgi:PST family polysaccharide transporter